MSSSTPVQNANDPILFEQITHESAGSQIEFTEIEGGRFVANVTEQAEYSAQGPTRLLAMKREVIRQCSDAYLEAFNEDEAGATVVYGISLQSRNAEEAREELQSILMLIEAEASRLLNLILS
ncbi:hypothetical protein J19TS2_49320 [Cohnella xylanilytica]|uniref:hypothetical protein n=1 Tax=Cohnella xylanilytica TaxID=557555 RepID=UPI001AFF8B24|nr:hypothetical protein [Cohnella xylanilytica]GIO15377.1 hypothetical protein J19TS2_49320 [Cohnella xylanilytica]